MIEIISSLCFDVIYNLDAVSKFMQDQNIFDLALQYDPDLQ